MTKQEEIREVIEVEFVKYMVKHGQMMELPKDLSLNIVNKLQEKGVVIKVNIPVVVKIGNSFLAAWEPLGEEMTKQEEIREGLIKFFTPPNTTLKGQPILEDNVNGVVVRLLEHLQSEGMVLKVDKKVNRDLTNQLFDAMGIPDMTECHNAIGLILKKAGYTPTIPLIEEETNE